MLSFPQGQKVFSLFQVDLRNIINNKFEFLYQKGVQFSETERLPYWEFEEYIKLFNQRTKEEAEKQKDQEKKYQQSSPKMPRMPNMNQLGGGYKMPRR
jgi:hypothetical protein